MLLDIPPCCVDETFYFGVDGYFLDSKTRKSVQEINTNAGHDHYHSASTPYGEPLRVLLERTVTSVL